jgi:hypothetical protein
MAQCAPLEPMRPMQQKRGTLMDTRHPARPLHEKANDAWVTLREKASGNMTSSFALFQIMQLKIAAWQARNFGETVVWHTALGAGEEGGELADCLLNPDFFSPDNLGDAMDALADITIFVMSFSTAHDLDFHTLWRGTDPLVVVPRKTAQESAVAGGLHVIRAIGKLEHAVLKRAQRIRGFDDDFKYQQFVALAIGKVGRACEHLAWLSGRKYEALVAEVAEKVLMRDWRKNPVTAASQG